MTTLPRTVGRPLRRRHDLDPAGSHSTPGNPHRQQLTPRVALASRPRELELLGLSDLPEEVSVRYYGPTTRDTVGSLLVPIAGGPHSYPAVRVSVTMARDWDATIKLLTVVADKGDEGRRSEAEARLHNYTDEITSVPTDVEVVVSDDVVATISRRAKDHELIVVGDSERSVFQRLFAGTVPRRLTDKTDVPIIVVERTA